MDLRHLGCLATEVARWSSAFSGGGGSLSAVRPPPGLGADGGKARPPDPQGSAHRGAASAAPRVVLAAR